MRVRIAALALAALLAAAAAARASPDLIDPTDAVPGHAGVTYLDLVREAVPDLAYNDADKAWEGHMAHPLRHAGGDSYHDDPPDPVTLTFIFDERIHVGGKPRIVLSIDLGYPEDTVESYTMLALYDDTLATPKLLDAVDIGLDKDTSFDEHAILPLGPGDDAIATYSEHFNSNQTYSGRLLLFPYRDHFQTIANLFTLSERMCGYEHDEIPAFTTRAVHGSPYREILLTVADTLTRNDEDCGDDHPPRPFHHAWHATYRWNAAKGRYVGDERGLAPLDKENKAEF